MKIAIIGYGVEGRAAYEYWHADNEITICDQNKTIALPADTQGKLGEDYLEGLEAYDLIVRSPFVRPNTIAAANSPEILNKVTSNTNEFLRVCPSHNIIGITGTKGKGTTSTLVTRMLEAAGKRVHLGGNIGVAALDLLKNNISADDWIVLELSSYQLLDLQRSPYIAACLMVMPEHLDWHQDINEYLFAKQQLFTYQSVADIAIYYPDNENSAFITSTAKGRRIPYMTSPGAYVDGTTVTIDGQALCDTTELKLLGKHNWQNVCAATTIVWQVTQDATAIGEALRNFSGLPFRIELRRTVNGVAYYNDSFATGPGACLAAINAIDQPKVMILGGFDRGLDLDELATGLLEHSDDIRTAILIGDSKERLAATLTSHGFLNFTVSNALVMPDIVTEARSHAQTGDAVVLSPGFASFGLFENFEDRGRKFNAVVESL